jgi:hypothetical protein
MLLLAALLIVVAVPRANALPPQLQASSVSTNPIAVGSGRTVEVSAYRGTFYDGDICLVIRGTHGSQDESSTCAFGRGIYEFSPRPPFRARAVAPMHSRFGPITVDLTWTGTGLPKARPVVGVTYSGFQPVVLGATVDKAAHVRGSVTINGWETKVDDGGVMRYYTPLTG